MNQQQMISMIMNNKMVQENPIMKNALEMYQKGNIKELGKLTEQVAKNKGCSLKDIYSQATKLFK